MTRITRRLALGAAAATLAAPALRAQGTAIRIIVPFAPGGSTDAVARLVAPGLTQRLGAPVVVENRSGAAGAIGTDAVAKARPDGLTWLLTFDSHATLAALLPQLPFNPDRDLDPVMLIGGAPYVLACKPDKPFRSITDVVDAARARPDAVSFGSTGNGTIGHLTMVLLQGRTNTRITHLPYRSGGLAVNDTVAGHTDMMIGSAAVVHPHARSGTLRTFAQFGPQRLPALSDLPTVAEAGLAGLEAEAWWGVFAPHGTPQDAVSRMNAALKESLNEERVRATMQEVQQARLVASSPGELATFLAREVAKWGEVVRANNIRAD
ncbi:tripartite tricarboxylate transporter substrate binding protein [Roseomonas sp. PWR1]|uniref:Tripartite tricarboxylate transporter substrate binding protein n=1 Tax=Roseomonas nitratireducens TaxID=2820810 RepID=A0ABS4AV25_9PROT|nr:tripartite tricarboxylate transporter substrate binding protein [Neoroseomonas nitratireducens]MBP0464636.1 tripartite tricarboxylate transporter substrate binding protein [Neoroseomonas nitratireducens]